MSRGSREDQPTAAPADSTGDDSGARIDYPHAVVKGKRTRRLSLLQALSPASSASSAGGSTVTEEEEYMAACLILLAQGGVPPRPRTAPEAAATAAINGKAGAGICGPYECKTCSKCFPTFQALGGHRASHKKPKTLSGAGAAAEEGIGRNEDAPGRGNFDGGIATAAAVVGDGRDGYHAGPLSSSRPRVHECSLCGSAFSSGQALGGHMRRHRSPAAASEGKKSRSVLPLDLNLPAPCEEDERGVFTLSPSSSSAAAAFSAKRQLVFSGSSTLVGCHY